MQESIARNLDRLTQLEEYLRSLRRQLALHAQDLIVSFTTFLLRFLGWRSPVAAILPSSWLKSSSPPAYHCTLKVPIFSVKHSSLVVPNSGIVPLCMRKIHDRAIWTGVAFLLLAVSCNDFTKMSFLTKFSKPLLIPFTYCEDGFYFLLCTYI